MSRRKLQLFLPLCETTEKPSVYKEHSIKMDTELKNFRSEVGLSHHNNSCVNQDYSTHTACTLRCVVLGCMSVHLHAKEETTKADDN